MLKLTDSQMKILLMAAQRDDGSVVLPSSLRGAAARRVIEPLLRAELLEELPASDWLQARRSSEDGSFGLRITLGGQQAIPADRGARASISDAGTPPGVGAAEPATCSAKGFTEPPENTQPSRKQTMVVEMLRRSEGATLKEIAIATGWQPHSVRGFLSGTVKKKLGLATKSDKANGERRYSTEEAR